MIFWLCHKLQHLILNSCLGLIRIPTVDCATNQQCFLSSRHALLSFFDLYPPSLYLFHQIEYLPTHPNCRTSRYVAIGRSLTLPSSTSSFTHRYHHSDQALQHQLRFLHIDGRHSFLAALPEWFAPMCAPWLYRTCYEGSTRSWAKGKLVECPSHTVRIVT